jgi:hypothetical protein
MGAFAAAPVLKIRSFQRAPPLLPPSECRDWRGVCKNGLQNLESQGVRSQNLENTVLRALIATSACTAPALAMICCLNSRVKVGCHTAVWKMRRRVSRESHSLKNREGVFCSDTVCSAPDECNGLISAGENPPF